MKHFKASSLAAILLLAATAFAAGVPTALTQESADPNSEAALTSQPSAELARYIQAMERIRAERVREIAAMRDKVRAGSASQKDLENLENSLKLFDPTLAARKRALTRRQAFERPVDLRLSDASVRQAAQALAQATGLTITVDKAVSEQTRLSVEARRVPLANVLETVARQANLLIAPTPNGVLLTTVPTLKVNGPGGAQSATFGSFPWSDAWGIPPTAISGGIGGQGGGFGGGGLGGGGGGFGGGGGGFGGPEVPDGDVSPQVIFTALPTGPLTVTPVGDDLLVVAERAHGPNSIPVPGSTGAVQETGIRFTTYRLDKTTGKLTRLSRTFFGGGDEAPKPSPAAAPVSGR